MFEAFDASWKDYVELCRMCPPNIFLFCFSGNARYVCMCSVNIHNILIITINRKLRMSMKKYMCVLGIT